MAHLHIAQLHVMSMDLQVLQVHFTPQTLLAPEHQKEELGACEGRLQVLV